MDAGCQTGIKEPGVSLSSGGKVLVRPKATCVALGFKVFASHQRQRCLVMKNGTALHCQVI
jgi:hypothetical protein